MSTSTQTSKWQETADQIIKKADYPPVYESGLNFTMGAFVGLILGMFSALFTQTALFVVIMVNAAVIMGILAVVLDVHTARDNAAFRYQNAKAHATEALEYFATHLDDDAALALSAIPNASSKLYHYSRLYQRLDRHSSSAVVDQAMRLAYATGQIDVIEGIQNAIGERSKQGWVTTQDVYDVTSTVLSECVAAGAISARSFRDGLRRILYQVDTSELPPTK